MEAISKDLFLLLLRFDDMLVLHVSVGPGDQLIDHLIRSRHDGQLKGKRLGPTFTERGAVMSAAGGRR
jgi:hypothetical protein